MAYRNKFLDRKELPTCLAPWHALTIKWGGNVIPDIIYQGKLGNINRNTLKEILEGPEAQALRTAHRNRTIPDVCSNCAKKETSGRSRRMFFWDKIDYDVRLQSQHLQVGTTPDIRYLDFTVSNKCNLACIHCNPFVSTGWTRDGKKLNSESPAYWKQSAIGFHGAEVKFMDNLFANPEYFRNLQWVALRGGEPLYDERCLEILQWFVDAGISHNIMLDISTNATVFNDEFRILFAQFKHVELLVSVEATDELYSIVRGGPHTWSELNHNIEKFYEIENLEMVFAVTVMTTNVFNLPMVWEWFNKYHATRASIAMSNVVVDPAYLNIGNMPAELRAQALDAIKDIPSISYWPEGSYHREEFEYQTGIDDIRRGLSATPDPEQQATQWQHFLDYTNDLDRLRSTNTLEYIPEIRQYVNSR
jgi:MoaA/NifB/PqqE/SkfB family radical SAM enzyme